MAPRTHRWTQLSLQGLFGVASPIHIAGTIVFLPFIQTDLGLTKVTVAWIFIVYLLSTASFMLAAAYLGNALGRRKLAIIGVGADLVSQIGVFFVPSFAGLILLRMFGGIGNSMVVANMAPLTVTAFPDRQRGRVLGLMNLAVGAGILASTPVAGMVADVLGWRYLYLFTACAYAVLLVGMCLFMRESVELSGDRVSYRRFDYAGLSLVTSFLVFLTLGVQQLGTSSTPALGIAMLCAAVLSAVGFVAVERRSPYALFPVELFSRAPFTSALGRLMTFFVLRTSLSFLMPFYFVQGLGWSGAFAGTVLIALNLGHPVIAPVAGVLADRVGPPKLVVASFIAMVGACVWLFSLGSDPSVFQVVASLLLAGAAIGLFVPPNQKIIYDNVPREKLSLAPGALVLTGAASGAIGSAIASMLLSVFQADSIPSAYQQSVLVLLAAFVILNLMLARVPGRREKTRSWSGSSTG